MESERAIERWLGDELRQAGFLYFKFVSPANPGVPDRIVVCPDGAVFFVELKTVKGVLSKQQQVCIRQLTERHAKVYLVKGMGDARYFAEQLVLYHGMGGAERGQV